MFVGVGATRVRDLFKTAREASPCIIFIDEIDAVGRVRGAGVGGGHDEREQTLNQILSEMDGFQQGETVIVLAATNRSDVLDPALLRPGRFDRHVWLTLPSDQERFEILSLNCQIRGLDMSSPELDLVTIARECISFSGADLANVINEAVFFSLRRKSKSLSMADLRAGLNKCKQVVYNRNRNVSSPSNQPARYEDISTALE